MWPRKHLFIKYWLFISMWIAFLPFESLKPLLPISSFVFGWRLYLSSGFWPSWWDILVYGRLPCIYVIKLLLDFLLLICLMTIPRMKISSSSTYLKARAQPPLGQKCLSILAPKMVTGPLAFNQYWINEWITSKVLQSWTQINKQSKNIPQLKRARLKWRGQWGREQTAYTCFLSL